MKNWNLIDLADAHEALDLQDAADSWYQKKAKEQSDSQRG